MDVIGAPRGPVSRVVIGGLSALIGEPGGSAGSWCEYVVPRNANQLFIMAFGAGGGGGGGHTAAAGVARGGGAGGGSGAGSRLLIPTCFLPRTIFVFAGLGGAGGAATAAGAAGRRS